MTTLEDIIRSEMQADIWAAKEGAVERLQSFDNMCQKLRADWWAFHEFVTSVYTIRHNIPTQADPEKWKVYCENGTWPGWEKPAPAPSQIATSLYNGITTY